MTGRPADPRPVDTDLATLRRCLRDVPESQRWESLGVDADALLDRVEAELARLREERDAARRQSRESSRMYVTANEQLTELLQQQSFMERKVTAQREDIERLATRVEKADAEVERLRSDKDERDWRTLEIVTKQAEAAEAELSRLREERDAALRAPMRFCLNVHGDLLCNGPQGHEGGCVFMPGWKLAREIEDELAKMVAYAGATTNELRETRGAAEAAEAECARLRQALTRTRAWIGLNVYGGSGEQT